MRTLRDKCNDAWVARFWRHAYMSRNTIHIQQVGNIFFLTTLKEIAVAKFVKENNFFNTNMKRIIV